MRLVCPICHAAYTIDERRLPSGGANVRCPKCRGVFSLVPGREPAGFAPLPPAPPALPVEPPAPVTTEPPPALAAAVTARPPPEIETTSHAMPDPVPDAFAPAPDAAEPTSGIEATSHPVAALPAAAVNAADDELPSPFDDEWLPPVAGSSDRLAASPPERTPLPAPIEAWPPAPVIAPAPPTLAPPPLPVLAPPPRVIDTAPATSAPPRTDLGFGEVALDDGLPFGTDEGEPRTSPASPPLPPSAPDRVVLGDEEPFPFESSSVVAPVQRREPAAHVEPRPFDEPPPPNVAPGAVPPRDAELEDLFAQEAPTAATDAAPTRQAPVPTLAATTVAIPPPTIPRSDEPSARAAGPAGVRSRRRRTIVVAAAAIVVVVLGIGGAAAWTRYGAFFHRLLRGHTGAHRPGAAFIVQARQRLAADRFTSVKSAVELIDRALRLDARDEEAQATYTYAVALLARRHGAASAAWTRARASLPELSKRVASDPEAAKAVLSAALVSGDRSGDAAGSALEKYVAKAGADGDALLVLGDAALLRGDLTQAASWYGKIDALEPGSARANHGLGVTAARRGDVPAARRLLESVLARDPQHLTTAVELASLALVTGEPDRAESLARDVLSDTQSQAGPRERARARTIVGLLLARGVDEHVEASLGAAERELEAAVQEDAADVEPRLALAQFLLDRGAPDRGLTALTPIPAGLRDGRVVAVQARLLDAQGKAAEANALVDAALANGPGDARLLFAKGTLANDAGKAADADRLWTEAAQRDPTAFEPHLAIAQARFLRGDLEGAERELKLAAERAPAHPRVISMGADLLLARRELAAARTGYDRALSVDRSHGPAYLGLARLALESRDPDAARAALQRAVAVAPRLATAQALYGEVLWNAGNLPASRKALEQAVALDPRDSASLARLGAIELLQGDRDAAVLHLRSAVGQTVPSAEVRAWYGRALLAKGEPQAAIEQLRKAVEIDPRDPLVHLQLGHAYERVSNVSDAVQSYRAAKERAPQMKEPYEALGMLFGTQNRCQDALPELQKAAALSRHESPIRVALADCKTKLGRHAEAVTLYRQVLQADPKQVGLYYKIARAQHEATGAREAMSWYEMAAREEPANAMPHYYMAFAHKERGRAAKAIAEFREYLRISPNALDRKDIEREIEYLGAAGEPERP